jgi:hypothetical protein
MILLKHTHCLAVQSTLTFDTTIYLSPPAKVKQNYISNIQVRLGVVASSTDLSDANAVIQALDSAGIVYENLFTLSNINID